MKADKEDRAGGDRTDRPTTGKGNTAAVETADVIDSGIRRIDRLVEDLQARTNSDLEVLARVYRDGMEGLKHGLCQTQSARGLGDGFLPDDRKMVKERLEEIDAKFDTKLADLKADFEHNTAALLAARKRITAHISGADGTIQADIIHVSHAQVEQ